MKSYSKTSVYEQPYSVPGPEGYDGASRRGGKEQVEEVIDLLFRRKWIIVLTFVLVAAGAAVYTFSQTPEYETSSTVMVNLATTSGASSAPGMMGGEQLFATNGRTLAGELFIIQNSRTIADRVYKRVMEQQGAQGADAADLFRQGYAYFSPASKSVNAMLVTGVSSDPEHAALLANLYAEEYVRLTQDASRTYMSMSREFLEQQEAQRQEELRGIEEQITSYMQREGAIGLDREGSTIVSRLAELEAQRDNAKIELQMKQSSLSVIERELSSISPQLARRIASGTDRKIQVAQEKLTALEAEKNEILLRYPEGDPAILARTNLPQVNGSIQQLKDEITALSEQYVKEVASTGGITQGEAGLSYVADLKRQAVQEEIAINGLEAQIEVVERRIRESELQLSGIPSQSLELARLQRAKEHAEQMYQFVVAKLQETRVAEESEPGYAHVLSQAFVPSEPVRPERVKNMVLGLFFGLLAGLGLAIVRDKIDNRIYKPEHLRELDSKVLGVIPNMSRLVKEEHAGAAFIESEGRRISTTLVSLLNPMSGIMESYRQLRTSIQFGRPDKIIQTMVVSSANMEEGKSTTAANLAVAMAQSGRRTLLVDADLRRPKQHTLFGLKEGVGLYQVLTEQAEADLADLKPAADNLWMLHAGIHVADEEVEELHNPAELLGSARMRDAVRAWRDHFDVVIIDTPPVFAASDAVLVSTQCDATVMVVRAGHTKHAEITYALEQFQGVGAQVLGLILNAFDVTKAYGHAYKYHSYSKYGPYAYDKYYAGTAKRSGSRRTKRQRA